jgi:hypothetical protein
MGKGWAKLGIAIGGALLGGWLLGPMLGTGLAMSTGFFAGSYLGNELFPTKHKPKMPPVHDYPIQTSSVGNPVTIVLGTQRVAGNIIWMGDLTPYTIKHTTSSGGGKGGGGGDEVTTYDTKYRRSFLIAICEGPAEISRAWRGKKEILLTAFTSYSGDNNSGISALLGEDYAEYSNMCCAYFENYELGDSQVIPNFIFEVNGEQFARACDVCVGGNALTSPFTSADMADAQGNFSHIMVDGSYFAKQVNAISVHPDGDFVFGIADFSAGGEIEKVTEAGVDVWQKGYIRGILSIHIDASGYIYACGYGDYPGYNDRLIKLDSDGNEEWTVLSGRTNSVYDVISDSSGTNVYVCDKANLSGSLRFIRRIRGSDGVTLWTGPSMTALEGRIALDPNEFIFAMCNISGKGSVAWIPTDESAYGGTSPVYYQFTDSNSWGGIHAIAGIGDYASYIYAGINTPTTGYVTWLGFLDPGQPTGPLLVHFGSYDVGARVYDIKTDTDGGLLVCHDRGTGENSEVGHLTKLGLDLSYLGCLDFANDRPGFVRTMARGSGTILLQGLASSSDMNFVEMIKTLLTNKKCGGYSFDDLITADFDSVSTYCDDNGLVGSLVITDQKPLADWIAFICSHFQGYFYEIGGKIGLNCFRDQASVLSIVQDDLVRDGNEPPVHITKRKYETTFNRLEATWSDRSKNYKTSVVVAFDRIDQRESGQVRTKTMDLRAITDPDLAVKMVWRIFIDQFYRFSQYNFKLGYKSMLLEVGDVIDVTDGHLLTAQKMRVMNVDEEKDGRRALITAVEDISAFYPGIGYSTQESESTSDSAITLTDGTVSFRENQNANELHLSIVPGGAQCNGFYIYKSYDDASYSLIGRSTISGVTSGDANSVGTILSNLPAYPSIVHRKDEVFNVSIGTLTDLDTSISDTDFFNNRKLAKIDNEIIAYQTCVESAVEGTWRISNIIRGLFGTEAVAHSPGETFATLDTDFVYHIQSSDIGKTIYFKVVSFFAKEIQAIADVTGQSHVIAGNYTKPLPVSLMRINGREGLLTYRTTDVTIDWYFCSKDSGFGRGGYGNALWGAYVKDPSLDKLRVELEEEDGTPIVETDYDLDDYGEPVQLEILEADRNSKNPVRVKITAGSNLLSDETRDILVEKI